MPAGCCAGEHTENCLHARDKASYFEDYRKLDCTFGIADDVLSTITGRSTKLSSAAGECIPVSHHCIAAPVTCAEECRIFINPQWQRDVYPDNDHR